MKVRRGWLPIAVVSFAFAAWGQEAIPAGTIIPVTLSSALSSRTARPGAPISTRVMQEVPLPKGMKIRKGTKVTGHVVQVNSASQGGTAKMSLALDRVLLDGDNVQIAMSLRAIASPAEIESAHLPTMGMGCGDTSHAWTTAQIGGEVVYWGGGPVENDKGPVGEPVT